MPARFNFSVNVQQPASQGTPRRRSTAIGACALLVAGWIFLLWLHFDFARYAVTGFLWKQAAGPVISPRETSEPTIQFAGRNGATHTFTEDYYSMCGGRGSICFIRDFSQGQYVPVVYEPSTPQRAFVDDWAHSAGVIGWFTEAGALIVLAMISTVLFRNAPLQLSFQPGNREQQ
jgi:hypothetical protein